MGVTKEADSTVDAVIVGAGISGMYQLYKLRQLGLRVKVFESGSDIGGTWYWNRYPGCRFDSESYSYCFSFSEELLQEWNWTEHFSPQPETLKYLQFVAEKFDLKKDIQFKTKISKATFIEQKSKWQIESDTGERVEAKYFITAIGALSEPYIPEIKNREMFKGQSWHTSLWPKEKVDLSNKRVGVIGTGATGVQMITEIAKTVKHLTVFQLRPEYCLPLRNEPIDEKTQKEIKANYPNFFKKCKESFGSFLHNFDERSALDHSEEERIEFYETLYKKRGFSLWLGNFHDYLTNQEANDSVSEFVRNKIRAQVDDPKTAEKLCPKDHGFGTRRVPMESGYYKAYNQSNVELVDISETPIKQITEAGIETSDSEYELDLIIYATGFDAITGAFKKIDIIGKEGISLQEKWSGGPSTYLGIQTTGFPNMFTLVGPHNGATFCNIPRCIEQNVEWVTDCISHLNQKNISIIEPSQEAEDEWTEHVYKVAEPSLLAKTDSWFVGANIPGKKRTFLMYAGGSPAYREKCDQVAANNYDGFKLSS